MDLLQGIQTSFRHENVAYVIAADRNWIKSSFENRYSTFSDAVGSSAQPLGHLFLEKVFQVSTPLPGMGSRTRAEYWDRLLKGVASVDSDTRTPDLSDSVIEEKRETLRRNYGDNFSSEQASAELKTNSTPEDRAAVALELSASPTAEAEVKHLLSQFKDIVPDIPRVMKRMINAFALRQAIGVLEGNTVSTLVLARWTIFDHRYPALADLITEHPEWLTHIAKKITPSESKDLPEQIKPFLNSEEIINILGKDSDSALTESIARTITRGSLS